MTFYLRSNKVKVFTGIIFDIEEARRILWAEYPHAVRAHTLRTVTRDGEIYFDVDWKSVIMLPTSKIILTRYYAKQNQCQ